MEEKILFERALFRDGKPDHYREIDDIDFVVNTLVNLSKFRPQKSELIFEFHQIYSTRNGFREKFLERALNQNSFFVNILIDKNIYQIEEIYDCFYDTSIERAETIRFLNYLTPSYDSIGNDFQNTIDLLEMMFQTDYPPGTIEYCVKYDDIDGIIRFYQDPSFFKYEVHPMDIDNIMNLDFDILGLCGFFGSMKCFKFFLGTHLFTIDQSVVECVVCGGSIEIFRLCLQVIDISEIFPKLIIFASCYNNLDLLCYFHENGAKTNEKTEEVEFFVVIRLLFILLLLMVILVLLNI